MWFYGAHLPLCVTYAYPPMVATWYAAGGEALAALSSGELDVLQWDADTIQAAMRLLQGAGQLE